MIQIYERNLNLEIAKDMIDHLKFLLRSINEKSLDNDVLVLVQMVVDG